MLKIKVELEITLNDLYDPETVLEDVNQDLINFLKDEFINVEILSVKEI